VKLVVGWKEFMLKLCRRGVSRLNFLLYIAKCKTLQQNSQGNSEDIMYGLPEGNLLLMTGECAATSLQEA
jgi:hypothetical protein